MFTGYFEGLPRLAPHTLVIRLTPSAIKLEDGLRIPATAALNKKEEAWLGLPSSSITQALQSLNVPFRVTRTYNVGGDEIERTARLPGIAAIAPFFGFAADSADPFGFSRTFTVYLEHTLNDQGNAEHFMLDSMGRLRQQTLDIAQVYPAACRFIAYSPTDPRYKDQWHHRVMDCEAAWEEVPTGE